MGLALYLRCMSVQRSMVAAPVVAELSARDGAARAPALVRPAPDEQLLPDRLLDALADRLSDRLVERLADRLVGSVADLTGRQPRHRDDVPSIPDGAKYATSEQLAARYQLSVQWVESRAAKLGATPISDSTNSKLRYHLATADAYMDSRRRRPTARARGTGGRRPKPRKRTHARTGRPLLDVE